MEITIRLRVEKRADDTGPKRYRWRARAGTWTYYLYADTPREALTIAVNMLVWRLESNRSAGQWRAVETTARKFGASGLRPDDRDITTRGPLAYSTATNDMLIAQAIRLATRTDDKELITRIVWPQAETE